jgi:DNA-binding Lrp family transcriptional regulator
MSQQTWHNVPTSGGQGRKLTVAQVIEAIDQHAPETKGELAAEVGLSEQYLSELVQELKGQGIITKSYVVDEQALYASVDSVSGLSAASTGDSELESQRRQKIIELLQRLDEVTRSQYQAALSAFSGDDPAEPADNLEALSNERHGTVVDELKSYTLATEWPSNRVAADLATVATNLEIVGDRACFISDVVDSQETAAAGVVEDSVIEMFEAGERINDHMSAILFDGALDRFAQLREEEETLHRDLNELFELVTAYDSAMYGYLVTVTRALERAIFYWVHSAELAVRLHSGQQPDHIEISI